MKIENVSIYGVNESINASGYPMKVEKIQVHKTPEESDLVRMCNLAGTPIGSGHDQALTGIIVQFDLTFSNKAWVELQRYHFIDFVSSQSTMHRISKFDLSKQYNEFVDERIIAIMEELKDSYNQTHNPNDYLKLLYSNPAGFQLTARMTTNFRQLKTIYEQRKYHRLPEWREFCEWIKNLPCADLFIKA